MAQYDVVAVSRTPQSASAPTLVELGPLYASFSLTENLIGADELSLSINIETILADIKTRLRDLADAPMEVWLYRDGILIFQGPVVAGDISDTIVSLSCFDASFYMNYMLVTTDESWAAVDQFTIAAQVVDDWQALTYGNYGVDTSAISTSGQVRTFAIPGATEFVVVSDVIQNIADADNGFDYYINADRELTLAYPQRGSDLSTTVFLERGIKSPNIRFSVAPRLVASEAYLTGTASGETALTALKSNTTLRATFGRSGFGASVDNVSEQAMLDDLAQKTVDVRAVPFFQPGPGLIPVAGAQYADFGPGDTVTYAYDAGLGLQSGSYRVLRRMLELGDDGTESMSVEFE